MLNLNEVMVLPFEPDPFAVEQYEEMFDMDFENFITASGEAYSGFEK